MEEVTWTCRALGISKDDLFDPACVDFAPCWTVGFNSRFFPMDALSTTDRDREDHAFKIGEAVIRWRDENASGQMVVMGSGEVMCSDETDAHLLFLAFR